ncbi:MULTISPECIES: folate family ECF transporter S component [Oceanotoga]|jgi:ECF transporter S component (folate family)|uniref:ECF transporter S component (Folate family) n=1 Tax=Oceanotoga teriensis TaxID=515440 RepID=A0AA45C8B7_9BACT|nr:MULTISPECIES: folate family ECF transporter S component [Oceanotoga]MDN5341166.1 riboflavin transporter [Oceanotoga sp.]MDO7976847.1 folate family ECF transporter S component [Oceanotoga teriensis]PWJ95924.1 ECF transporter S component (folate family) [Oceanotoga teriensis]
MVKLKSSRKVVYAAILIALSIVLTRILSIRIAIGSIEGVRIGFGGFPIIFAGLIFGPVMGGIVGGVADIMGYLINPMGPFMPQFVMTSILTGVIPGIFYVHIFKNKKNFFTLMFSIAIGQIATSIILVPLFIEILFNVPMTVTVIPRIVGQAIHVPLYAWLTKVLQDRALKFSLNY